MLAEELRQGILDIIEATTKIKITETLLNMELDMAGVNSIKFVQIIVDIEERYNIELDDSLLDYTQFASLQSFIVCIVHRLSKDDLICIMEIEKEC